MTNMENIRHDLLIVANFFKINRWRLNITKSCLMHFNSRRGSMQSVNDIYIHTEGQPIQTGSAVTCLGLELNPHLIWRYHVRKIFRKLSSKVGIIGKHRHFVPIGT